jgi:hypothetical protein
MQENEGTLAETTDAAGQLTVKLPFVRVEDSVLAREFTLPE